MNIDLIKRINEIKEEELHDILIELVEKDSRACHFIEKYCRSAEALDIPRHLDMKAVIKKICAKASEVIRTSELEPYELVLLEDELIIAIDLWFEPIFHKRRYDKLLILSGLISTYNYDPFNELFLFPGIEKDINLRIKRFLESLSSPERRDFFYTIFELIESGLYPSEKGGPAGFLGKVLGSLESSNLNYDLDLLKFYDDYFGDFKENLILSSDLAYLPLFIHYCELIKIYRNDKAYQEIIVKSRFLREIVSSQSYFKYDPDDWEKEHLKRILSFSLFDQVTSTKKDIRETILNFDNYIKEHDLNDDLRFIKRKN